MDAEECTVASIEGEENAEESRKGTEDSENPDTMSVD